MVIERKSLVKEKRRKRKEVMRVVCNYQWLSVKGKGRRRKRNEEKERRNEMNYTKP